VGIDEANPFCQRCKEDFPVDEDGRTFQMGFLRPIDKIPKRLWRQLHIVDWEFSDGRGTGPGRASSQSRTSCYLVPPVFPPWISIISSLLQTTCILF